MGSNDEQVVGYVADAVAQLDAEGQLFTADIPHLLPLKY